MNQGSGARRAKGKLQFVVGTWDMEANDVCLPGTAVCCRARTCLFGIVSLLLLQDKFNKTENSYR